MDTSIRQRSKLRVVRNKDESLATSALRLTQYAQLLGPEHVNDLHPVQSAQGGDGCQCRDTHHLEVVNCVLHREADSPSSTSLGSSSIQAISFFCGCVTSHAQRTIPCRRDPKGGFKHPTEMCLISKTSLYGDLDQWSALSDELFAGKVKTPHEQIAVGTGPTHDPKLPGQIVAGESSHRLQLR